MGARGAKPDERRRRALFLKFLTEWFEANDGAERWTDLVIDAFIAGLEARNQQGPLDIDFYQARARELLQRLRDVLPEGKP